MMEKIYHKDVEERKNEMNEKMSQCKIDDFYKTKNIQKNEIEEEAYNIERKKKDVLRIVCQNTNSIMAYESTNMMEL